MFKVVIVDDEIWLRNELRACIESKGGELDLVFAGEAANGKEACDLITDSKPDIIVTDIKMPLMDGMELLRWVADRQLACKVIVLSGFGDFEFARQALIYKAFDYILKPLEETEIFLVISRAVDEIRRENERKQSDFYKQISMNKGLTILRDRFFNRVMTDRTMDENEIVLGGDELGLALPGQGFAVATIKFFRAQACIGNVYKGDRQLFDFAVRNILEELLPRNTHFFQAAKSNEYLILLRLGEKHKSDTVYPEELRLKLEGCLKLPVWIGIGGQRRRYETMNRSYQESLQALFDCPVSRAGEVAVYGARYGRQTGSVFYEKQWDQLCDLLTLFGESRSALHCDRVVQLLERLLTPSEDVSWLDVKNGFSRVLLIMDKWLLEGSFPDSFFELLQSLKRDHDEMDVESIALHSASMFELLLRDRVHAKSTKGKDLIHSVKKYAEQHLATVTLDEVSQLYGINKNYFCSLFKQATGRSFSEFLAQLRMNKAAVMLSQSDLRIAEIAQLVGYMDQRYFSQVFRKYHALRPGEYRESKRGLPVDEVSLI